MKSLDQITICTRDHRTDLGEGKIKIGPDYACIYTPELAEHILPNWSVSGYSIVASCAGEVYYTGKIENISVHDSPRRSRTTFRCKPAESPDESPDSSTPHAPTEDLQRE